ncbi:MAG: DUF2148 domain-containing protein [Prevotellaceae bacterium]|nr:DUF2148 domain-containing protein [Prevotellaceae bacterium]
MALVSEETIRRQTLLDIARQIIIAACTAPKGRGRDTLAVFLAEGDTIEQLALQMEKIGEREDAHFFIRDAGNIRLSPVIVFIGSKILAGGIPACGYCGFTNCAGKDKYPEVPCVFNGVDLGIAVGSAVTVAAACKADNRVMFSVGKAAIELGLVDKDIKILFGIPLTSSSKSPFFDRK